MTKIHCYLRARRKEWCLTQQELAGLVGTYREKVRDVECGRVLPTSHELLAYAFVFGRATSEIFPAYAEAVQDAVMASAYRLSQNLEGDESPKGRRKNELIQDMLARVTSYVEHV